MSTKGTIPRLRATPLVWISFGLMSLTVSIMLAGGELVELVPNRDQQVLEYRRSLAESLAVQYSALVDREQLETLKFSMTMLAGRHPDILSVALVQQNGTMWRRLGPIRKYGCSHPGTNRPSTFSKCPSSLGTTLGGCSKWPSARCRYQASIVC